MSINFPEITSFGTLLGYATALETALAELGAAAIERQSGVLFDGLWRDVKHSVRALSVRPGFTVVAVLTLSLGIGATTAMFSAVNSVLLRPLPYRDAENVVALYEYDAAEGELTSGVSAANIRDLDEASELLSAAGVAEPFSHDLMEDGRAASL